MYAPVPPGNQYSTTIPNTNLYNKEQEAILTMTGVNAHLATASGEDINGTGGTPNHDSDYAYYPTILVLYFPQPAAFAPT